MVSLGTIYPYRQRLVSQPYLVRLRGGNPGILFVLINADAAESRFPSQLVDASIAKRITPDEQYPVWLKGSFRFIWRRRVLNLL